MAVTLDYVEYPSGPGGRRQVHYDMPDAGTDPIGAALGRVASITDGASATYASYTYLGTGSIVQITHPDVSGGLTLSHGSSGSYGGLDDLGRVVDQHWTDGAGTTTIDRTVQKCWIGYAIRLANITMGWARQWHAQISEGYRGLRSEPDDERLLVLEEAICNSIANYVNALTLASMYRVEGKEELAQEFERHIADLEFLSGGHLGSAHFPRGTPGRIDGANDFVVLTPDIWRVMNYVMENGCDKCTDPVDILKNP